MSDTTIFLGDEFAVYIDGQRMPINGALRFVAEFDTVREPTNYQLDPEWSYIDSAGHFHAWDKDGKTPTLSTQESEPYWCDSCQDQHTDSWKVCSICKEKITPEMIDKGPTSHSYEISRSYELAIPKTSIEPGIVSVRIVADKLDMFGVMRVSGRIQTMTSNGDEFHTELTGQLVNRLVESKEPVEAGI